MELTIILAAVVAGATPILLATLGETVTEKAGIINLSLDGSILLSAMTGFVTAYKTQSLSLGFLAAGLTGATVAAVLALFSIYLQQSQVAVGFVLTLMTRDLAYFLGNSYCRLQGLQVPPMPIPILHEIPFAGDILFNHNLVVYFSFLLIGVCGWYIYKTPLGLKLRALGENPQASFARGMNPRKAQLFYVICGGFLVGLAGAAFSLSIKAGWGRPQGAEGTGWIALALVIFGGWNPIRAALGAYFFSFLQVAGIYLQGSFPSVPAQVFQVAPFPLMIFTLLIISFSQKERVQMWTADKPILRSIIKKASQTAPTALGKEL